MVRVLATVSSEAIGQRCAVRRALVACHGERGIYKSCELKSPVSTSRSVRDNYPIVRVWLIAIDNRGARRISDLNTKGFASQRAHLMTTRRQAGGFAPETQWRTCA